MAKVPNGVVGGYEDYPEIPDVNHVVDTLLSKGYAPDDIRRQIANQPINAQVASSIERKLDAVTPRPDEVSNLISKRKPETYSAVQPTQSKDTEVEQKPTQKPLTERLVEESKNKQGQVLNATQRRIQHIKALSEDKYKAVGTRSALESAQDTGATLMTGLTMLGKAGYDAANLATRNVGNLVSKPIEMINRMKQGQSPASIIRDPEFVKDTELGDSSETRKFFDMAQKYWRESKSEEGQANAFNVNKRVSELMQLRDSELAEKADENGENSWWDIMGSEGAKAADVISTYAGNPEALATTALESGLQFVIPATAAGLYTKASIKAGKLTADQIKKGAENVSTGAIGLMEGASAGGEAQEKVRNMSFEDLEKTSRLFRTIVSEGYSEEEAREAVASNVYGSVSGIQTVLASTVGKLTGAAKLEGNLFQTGSGQLLNMPVKAIIAGGKEATEEAFQSGTGRLTQNTAIKLSADDTQSWYENAAEEAALGFVTGAASGGALGAVGATTEGFKKQATYLADLNRLAKGEEADVTNIASPNYNPKKAVNAMLDNRVLTAERLEDDEKLREHVNKTAVHVDNLRQQTVEAGEAVKAETEGTREHAAAVKKAQDKLAEFREINDQYKQYYKFVEEGDVEGAIKLAENFEDADDTNVQKVLSVLGSSPDSFNNVDLNSIIRDERLSDEERAYVSEVKEYQDTVKQFESTKNTQDVSSDVLRGGDGFRGAKEYLQDISTGLKTNTPSAVDGSLAGLTAFKDQMVKKAKDARKAFQAVVNNADNMTELTDAYAKEYSQLNGDSAYIGPASKKYVAGIEQDAQVLEKAIAFAEQQIAFNQAQKERAAQPTEDTEVDLTAEDDAFMQAPEVTEVTAPQQTTPTTTVPTTNEEVIQAAQNEAASIDMSEPDVAPVSDENTTQEAVQEDSGATAEESTVPAVNEKIKTLSDKTQKSVIPTRLRGLMGSTKNFYDTILKNPAGLKNFITKKDDPNTRALRVYRRYHKNIMPHVVESLKAALETTTKADMSIYELVQGESFTDIAHAITTASFEYLGSTNGKISNTDDMIASLVGKSDKDQVTPAEQRIYRNVGDLSSNVYSDIGRNVAALLGITFDKSLSEFHRQTTLNQLGMVGVDALRSANLLELNTVTNEMLLEANVIDKNDVSDVVTDKNGKEKLVVNKSKLNQSYNYLSLAVEATEDGINLVPALARITKFHVTYAQSYNKLFGFTSVKVPSLVKPKSVAKKVKRVNTDVSKDQQATMYQHNRKPLSKKRTFNTLMRFSDKAQIALAGVVTDFSSYHVSELETRKDKNGNEVTDLAANMQIRRDLEAAKAWGESIGDREFYIESEVWATMRMGVSNSYVNPQGSKVARGLFGYSAHNQTVDSAQSRLIFKMAVLQSFDNKVELMADEAEINAKFDELINSVDVKAAIGALRGIEAGTYNEVEQAQLEDVVLKAVNQGGENLLTLQALTALLDYSPTESFDTDLALEIDGVTNGVLLSVLQMGGLKNGDNLNSVLNEIKSGGLFADGTQGYAEYKQSPSAKDFYERLSTDWVIAIKDQLRNAKLINLMPQFEVIMGSYAEPLNAVTGELEKITSAGRNASKPPTMTVVYGANIDKVVDNFVEQSVPNLYAKIAKAKNEIELNEIGQALTDIGVKGIPRLTMENKNTFTFTLEQERYYKETLDVTYGVALNEALNASFTHLMDTRTKANDLADIATELFKKLYDHKVEAFKQANNISETDMLSQEQEDAMFQELIEISPTVPSATSEGLADGLRIFKLEKENFGTASQYKLTTPKRKNFIQPDGSKQVSAKAFKSVASRPKQRQIKNSGVSAVVKMIHQLDSAIMQIALSEHTVLNVHDAVYAGVNDAVGAAKTLNSATRNISKQYNLVQNIADMFDRVNTAYVEEFGRDNFYDDATRKFGKPRIGLELLGQSATVTQRKNKIIDSVTSVDQYSLLGGQVDVVEAALNKGKNNTTKTLRNAEKKNKSQAALGKEIGELVNTFLSGSEKTLGSGSGAFGAFNPTSEEMIDAHNSMGVFNRLNRVDGAKLSSGHKSHLQTIMGELVNKVITPLTLQIENTTESTMGQFDVIANTVKMKLNGSSATNAQMSATEVYVHELVHAVTQYGIENDAGMRRHLMGLYDAALKSITVEDIAGPNPSADALAEAQNIYNYVFVNVGTANGTNAYLHEFVAYGLTNEKFKAALAKMTVTNSMRKRLSRNVVRSNYESTFLQKFDNLVEALTNFFKDMIYGVFLKRADMFNASGDQALLALVQRIAEVETQSTNVLSAVDRKLTQANAATGKAINKFIIEPLSSLGRKAPDAYGVGSAIRAVSRVKNYTYGGAVQAYKSMANRHQLAEDSLARALVAEFSGSTKAGRGWNKLMRLSHKLIDQSRNNQIVETKRILMQKFESSLNTEDKQALYGIGLNLDLSSLIETPPELLDMNSSAEVLDDPKHKAKRERDFDYMMRLMKDSGFLVREMDRIEKLIREETNSRHAQFIIEYAESLGLELATGSINKVNHISNAYGIVRMFGHAQPNLEGDLASLEKLTDQLATLQGVLRADKDAKARFAKVVDNEIQATNSKNNNGVMFMLQMHNFFKRNSLEKLFNGDKSQTMKGYVREEFDPNIEMIFVKPSLVNEMKKEGYVDNGPAAKDDADINRNRYNIMTRNAPAMEPWMKTIVSLTGERSRGHRLIDNRRLEDEDDITTNIGAKVDTALLKRVYQNQQVRGMYNTRGETSQLKPIFRSDGSISEYRYVMNHNTKKTVLNMNTEFDAALGRMVGSVTDKVNTRIINEAVVSETKKQFDTEFKGNPNNFVYIGKEANKTEHRELWQQLPDAMKDNVEQVWGDTGFYINKDDFVKIFGFRKFSLADWADQQRQLPIELRKFYGFIGDRALKALGGYTSRRVGRGMQELATLAKDSIVIKTLDVLVGNVMSNGIILLTEGLVSPKGVKWMIEGWRYAEEYQDTEALIVDLENELEASPHWSAQQRKATLAKISRLRDDLRTNPAHELIEQGVFQTIVEDLEFNDDRYTYLTELKNKSKPFTDNVPDVVKDVGSIMFMTHNTRMYKLLRNYTQLSDFAARYALHKHNKQKGMKKEDSLDYIMDTFVEYDSPTHKSIQYANDMGLFMFTKFYLRIQKVIMRQGLTKPLNTIMLLMFQNLLNINTPDIFGTFIGDPENAWNRLAGPLNNVDAVAKLHMTGMDLIP